MIHARAGGTRIANGMRLAAAAALLAVGTLAPGDLAAQEAGPAGTSEVAIVIHGGAGTILPENMTEEREARYREALRRALEAGHGVLESGGSSVDAVVAAIRVMEESPLFNSGKGAVFTSAGTVELDASIMDGRTRNSGAVAGVKRVRSPIRAARLVMDESPHVMLAGDGADDFAERHGLETVENEFFHTERRRRSLERARERERRDAALSLGTVGAAASTVAPGSPEDGPLPLGTVGAAALDRDGDLAAGTSTGGMTNKRWGRIGDSPIIGAGTYAENGTAAISATGHGEYFIRGVITHDIAAMMRYTGLSLTEAANAVIMGKLTRMGGTGGVIALDRTGEISTPFNTPGMYRGWIDTEGNVVIRIFRD